MDRRRLTLASVALLACGVLCGCVPLAYRPSVTVHPQTISEEAAPAVLLKVESAAWLGKVGRNLQRAEPRIVFIDGPNVLSDPSDFLALPDVIARLSRLPPGPTAPDFLLGLSAFTNEQIHDSDYYLPLVGYEKIQHVARLPASIVELRSGHPAEALNFESQYSEMVAQFFYGVMTVPMPERAIHRALVAEVSRRLRAARPSGPIRLLVMFQKQQQSPKAAEGRRQASTGVETAGLCTTTDFSQQ